ncbi:hypothetical protein EDF58_102497 [Novosphingobium sp. PhB57]|nr:hypothetical protein EDF58_102497 [Novosphingobium sp. PhB57]
MAAINNLRSMDPERRAAIEDAVRALERRTYVPLVRTDVGLSIHPAHEHDPHLRAASLFEAEPVIQDAFRQKWQALISALSCLKTDRPDGPVVLREKGLAPVNISPDMQAAVEPVIAEADVQAALQQASESWRAQNLAAERDWQNRAEEKRRKKAERVKAINQALSEIRSRVANDPRFRQAVEPIYTEINVIVKALANSALTYRRDEGGFVFRAPDVSVRFATGALASTPAGRLVLNLLHKCVQAPDDLGFGWASWQVEIPSRAISKGPSAAPIEWPPMDRGNGRE